jgi:hypothetical protein
MQWEMLEWAIAISHGKSRRPVLITAVSMTRGENITDDQVDITCGTTNALLSIMEPEKCEYHFKVTSPALCWPLDKDISGESQVKQEL